MSLLHGSATCALIVWLPVQGGALVSDDIEIALHLPHEPQGGAKKKDTKKKDSHDGGAGGDHEELDPVAEKLRKQRCECDVSIRSAVARTQAPICRSGGCCLSESERTASDQR